MLIYIYLMIKKGVSAVIATVLLILILIAAIALLWVLVLPMIERISEFNEPVSMKILDEGYTSYDPDNKLIDIQVGRDDDGSSMVGFNLIFEMSDGNSITYKVTKSIERNCKTVFYFNFSEIEGNLKVVKIAPVYTGGKNGPVVSSLDVSDVVNTQHRIDGKVYVNPVSGESYISCVSDCSGRECGGDGCGGQCPPGCDLLEVCNDGICNSDICESDDFSVTCSNVECGLVNNNCGIQVDCGSCGLGICVSGTCIDPSCVPESESETCFERECGFFENNCGANIECGSCTTGQVCQNGKCLNEYTGNIYYVSNYGNDNNNGLSEITPWRTLNRVNSNTFHPGDAVLFRRGDVWRENLNIPSSGNSTHQIVFGAYGTGSKPIISSSVKLSSPSFRWMPSSLGNNIYYLINFDGTNPNINPNYIWLNGVNIVNKGTFSLDNHEWNYGNADSLSFNTIYIRDNSGNPDVISSEIEASVRNMALTIISKNFITIKDIHFKHTNSRDWYGVIHTYNSRGIKFDSCEVEQGGWRVIHILDSSDIVINNCSVHGVVSDQRSRALLMQSRIRNITISNNHFYDALDFDDVAIIYNGANGLYSDAILINNTIHDVTTGNYIQYNTRNILLKQNTGFRTGNFFRIRGISDNITIAYNYLHNVTSGLMITGEDGMVSNVFLYNNFIYNINRGGGFFIWSTADPPSPTRNVNNLQFRNNLVVFYSNGITLLLDNLDVITSNNNIFYTTNSNALQIWINGIRYNFNYWTDTLGKDGNSFFNIDPRVRNPTTSPELNPSSPAIDAGIDLGYRYDFNNKAIVGNPDIGAFEYR
jgi:hypothetical protein